ncbi:MAG: hypothetical protein ICV61_07240 [Microcoleus sp. Co-bin12]|nr:hypothetical protein [Microcoleus sp. Co-bin12]
MAVAVAPIVRFLTHNSRINDLKYRHLSIAKESIFGKRAQLSSIFRNRQITLLKPAPPDKYLY